MDIATYAEHLAATPRGGRKASSRAIARWVDWAMSIDPRCTLCGRVAISKSATMTDIARDYPNATISDILGLTAQAGHTVACGSSREGYDIWNLTIQHASCNRERSDSTDVFGLLFVPSYVGTGHVTERGCKR